MSQDSRHQPATGPRLSSEEAADLVARVKHLSAAGLPLGEGLRAAAEELPARPARALQDLAQAVDAGQSLDAALAALGDRVPAHLGTLLSAGLRSNQLAQVLEGYVEHQRRLALARQGWLAVAYPAMLIAMVVCLALFFVYFVTTGVADVFEDFGTELPAQTQLLRAVSRVGWPVWLGIAAFLVLVVVLDSQILRGRVRHTIASLVPIVGPLQRWIAMAGLSRLLALLIEQHVPLPDALQLAAGTLGDPPLRRDVHRLAHLISAGESMADAARFTRLPATFAALPGWQESPPLLAQSLRAAAELFDRQAEAELKLLRSVTPALAFIVVLLAVFFLVSSTMLPLVKIIETLT
jgi:type IV pilus assembly protein PilC